MTNRQEPGALSDGAAADRCGGSDGDEPASGDDAAADRSGGSDGDDPPSGDDAGGSDEPDGSLRLPAKGEDPFLWGPSGAGSGSEERSAAGRTDVDRLRERLGRLQRRVERLTDAARDVRLGAINADIKLAQGATGELAPLHDDIQVEANRVESLATDLEGDLADARAALAELTSRRSPQGRVTLGSRNGEDGAGREDGSTGTGRGADGPRTAAAARDHDGSDRDGSHDGGVDDGGATPVGSRAERTDDHPPWTWTPARDRRYSGARADGAQAAGGGGSGWQVPREVREFALSDDELSFSELLALGREWD